MRTYKGARQVTGRAAPRGMPRDINTRFPASYPGNCRGCGMPYHQGSIIISPGKGQGAYHPRCYKARSNGVFAQQAARKDQESKQGMTWQEYRRIEQADAKRAEVIRSRRIEAKGT